VPSVPFVAKILPNLIAKFSKAKRFLNRNLQPKRLFWDLCSLGRGQDDQAREQERLDLPQKAQKAQKLGKCACLNRVSCLPDVLFLDH
jgi:hypothetical protein